MRKGSWRFYAISVLYLLRTFIIISIQQGKAQKVHTGIAKELHNGCVHNECKKLNFTGMDVLS